MKKLFLLLLAFLGITLSGTLTGYAAEPAVLLQKPRLKIGQQLSEYVTFYLNPTPVKEGSMVHEIYVHTGQSALVGRVAITLVDDGGVLFQTSDLMEGSYTTLGLAIVRVQLDRELSENLSSLKLKTVRAQSRLIQSPRDGTRKTSLK